MNMYLFQFQAKPKPDSPEALRSGGSVVNCWMDMDSLETAKATAMDLIHEAGWTVVSLEEAQVVDRSDLDETKVAYFDQALIDKTVLVFHSWPVDRPDADDDT